MNTHRHHSRGHRLLALLFALILVFQLAAPVVEAYTETVHMEVGDTEYLRLSTTSGKAVTSYAWSSNAQNWVQIVSDPTSPICQIRAVGSTGSSYAIIQCVYSYMESGPYGGIYLRTGFEDFRVWVKEGVEPTNIYLDSTRIGVDLGKTFQLDAFVEPSSASQYCTWSTQDSSIATVSQNGLVRGISLGTTYVTARTTNGLSATCEVLVLGNEPSKIAFESKEAIFGLGQQEHTYPLTVRMTPSNATTALSWESTKTNVATVSYRGYLKPKALGYTTIYATSTLGRLASCKVTIAPYLYVDHVSPSFGGGDVPVDSTITLTINRNFSEGTGYQNIALAEVSSGNTVPCDVAKGSGNTLTLTPLQNLSPGTMYMVTVPKDALKSDGETLWTPYASLFQTAEATAQPKPALPYTDVPAKSWFTQPVRWATEQSITQGISATEFGSSAVCNRAQVVTFLWRAMGSPEPSSTVCPFTDVKPGKWYSDAVLWAVEQGITQGLSATEFGLNESCNRAQVVTFLWRAAGSPEPSFSTSPYIDVSSSKWYGKPVFWALENGVTQGTALIEFGSNLECNRATVVTFLYRAFAE